MRYLSKTSQSIVIAKKWKYSTKSQRPKIRQALIEEQQGYCAYSEKYISPMHASEIEHFDDSKKNTAEDNYWNWYAISHLTFLLDSRRVRSKE